MENSSSNQNENSPNEVRETENLEVDSKDDSPEKQKLMVDEYHTVMVPDPIEGRLIFCLHSADVMCRGNFVTNIRFISIGSYGNRLNFNLKDSN